MWQYLSLLKFYEKTVEQILMKFDKKMWVTKKDRLFINKIYCSWTPRGRNRGHSEIQINSFLYNYDLLQNTVMTQIALICYRMLFYLGTKIIQYLRTLAIFSERILHYFLFKLPLYRTTSKIAKKNIRELIVSSKLDNTYFFKFPLYMLTGKL